MRLIPFNMRRPKALEIGAGIVGAALGAAIGAAVEGGVPEVVKANVPPDNSRNFGVAVGVEESRQAAIAALRDKVKVDAPKSVEMVGGGEPPEPEDDSAREAAEADRMRQKLFDDVTREVKAAFPGSWTEAELEDAYEVANNRPVSENDEVAAAAASEARRQVMLREMSSVVVSDYVDDFLGNNDYKIKVSVPLEGQTADTRLDLYLKPVADGKLFVITPLSKRGEHETIIPSELPDLMQRVYTQYLEYLEELQRRDEQ